MSIMELGALGEFVGAFAMVVTLVYLAIQVRDAGRSAKFAAVQANRSERIAFFVSQRDSPYLPTILKKTSANDPLSDEERMRLFDHHCALWALQYSEWIQKELGVTEGFLQNHELTTKMLLQNTESMQWWQGVGSSLYPADFISYVEAFAPIEAPREGGAA